jgi:hypothetical protein
VIDVHAGDDITYRKGKGALSGYRTGHVVRVGDKYVQVLTHGSTRAVPIPRDRVVSVRVKGAFVSR